MSRRRRRQTQARAERRQRRLRMMIGAAAVAIVAVVALILVGGALRDDGGDVEHVAQREGRTLGSATAPVSIFVWEDFQCPHCKAANQEILARIEAEYVASGEVAIHFRHFPVLGAGSTIAAAAAECAAEQDRFWEFHDRLFDEQSGAQFSESDMLAYAGDLGLDLPSFQQCFDEGRYEQAVADELADGRGRGVESTPTFFIEGVKIVGARPYAEFESAIEDALKVG